MKVGISSLPSYCLTLLSFTKLLTIIPFRFLLPTCPLFSLVQITCNNNALHTLPPCQCLNSLPYRTTTRPLSFIRKQPYHLIPTSLLRSTVLLRLNQYYLIHLPTPPFETHYNIRNVRLQQLSTSSYLTAHFN